MQRREYRPSLATKITLGVLSAVLLGLGLAAFIVGIVDSPGDRVAGIAGGLVGLVLCSGLPVLAWPGVLTVDDMGLHLRNMYSRKDIPWEAVKAFRIRSSRGPQVYAVLRSIWEDESSCLTVGA